MEHDRRRPRGGHRRRPRAGVALASAELEPSPDHYAVPFRFDDRDRYFLWYSMKGAGKDSDRVLLDSHGDLVLFDDLDSLNEYVSAKDLKLHPESDHMALDLDAIEGWCNNPTADAIQCGGFIEAWNMMDDLLLTLGRNKLLHDGTNAIDEGVYEKLFWGTNPSALKPAEAEDFVPDWPEDQIGIIVVAFRRGLRNFRAIMRQ